VGEEGLGRKNRGEIFERERESGERERESGERERITE
jgi:hypothetical protein